MIGTWEVARSSQADLVAVNTRQHDPEELGLA